MGSRNLPFRVRMLIELLAKSTVKLRSSYLIAHRLLLATKADMNALKLTLLWTTTPLVFQLFLGADVDHRVIVPETHTDVVVVVSLVDNANFTPLNLLSSHDNNPSVTKFSRSAIHCKRTCG